VENKKKKINEKDLMKEIQMLKVEIKLQKKKNKKLKRLSRIDFETRLYNRRAFFQFLKNACKEMGVDINRRILKPRYCLVLFDIDNFKAINDNFGHPFGDKALKEVARFFKSSIRDIDILARLGGDEFGILFKDVDLNQARTILETILEKSKNRLIVKFSVGIIDISENKKYFPKKVFKKADDALLKAKKQGKDQIVIHNRND